MVNRPPQGKATARAGSSPPLARVERFVFTCRRDEQPVAALGRVGQEDDLEIITRGVEHLRGERFERRLMPGTSVQQDSVSGVHDAVSRSTFEKGFKIESH